MGQVNSYIQNMFAQDFMMSHIAVRGEISNCKYHSSGHIYFTLKDETGILKAVMFRSNAANGLSFHMDVGDRVIVLGEIRIYERDGQYQLYAQQVTRDGVGILYQKFMERKKELEEMGMFAQEYKRDIPRYAFRIGVVTAPTGAAIRDIQNISHRRNPYVQLLLYPALVQGEGATASIVEGIYAMEEKNVDVIIVGRGGGSMEDLWAFNEEIVARAIFECPIPIISAVGHETDYTIADYVADLRAPTPSAAAELAVFDYRQVQERLGMSVQTLLYRMNQQMELARSRVREYQLHLKALHPKNQLMQKRQYLTDLEESLERSMQEILQKKRHQLEMYAARLDGCSPLKKLQGSYAFVSKADGKPIHSVDDVQVNEQIEAQLMDGKIMATVCGTEKNGVVK
ncbi:exodeoxyribonuclease VII large subunit [uncultured Eubacterium sp.]|uniref:exodeoxyribonuclease VII large subunit n=1 Tax=uncultured Eubacterium sp. TaxID=165185 RepID=UPI0034322ED0